MEIKLTHITLVKLVNLIELAFLCFREAPKEHDPRMSKFKLFDKFEKQTFVSFG